MAKTRYQVFVSSTYRDLASERQAVIRALLLIDCIPSGMELFPADDAQVWEVITRVIDDCDYYVVVVGGRYGSLDDAGISYTQKEYEYARSIDIPVVAFVHSDPEGLAARDFELDGDLRDKLAAFRQTLRKNHTVSEWSVAKELEAAVIVGVQNVIKTRPRVGWVKASDATSPEELARLRGQVLSLSEELADVSSRQPAPPEDLADGAEPFPIPFAIRFRPEGSLSYRTATANITLTWDEILAAIGPMLLTEAGENKILGQLAQTINQRTVSTRRSAPVAIELDGEAFGTIKIQLLSLGLIQESERRRAVHDKEAYWTLTSRGRQRLLQLRAIRKQPAQTGGTATAKPSVGGAGEEP